MMCKYEDLPLREDYLYITETTDKLESKSGQSKAFEQKFLGYQKGFELPIRVSQFKKIEMSRQ